MGKSRLFTVLILVIGCFGVQAQEYPEFATAKQAEEFIKAHANERFIVEPDARENPVKRTDRIPARWLDRPGPLSYQGPAQKGEFNVFQVSIFNNSSEPGVIATADILMDGKPISEVCLNREVSLEPGRRITIPPHRIQTLWFGVQYEKQGSYKGAVKLTLSQGDSGYFETIAMPVTIHVGGDGVANDGVNEGSRLSRLKWFLPSDIGQSDQPTKGYRNLIRHGSKIQLTSTTLTISKSGLPAQVTSNSRSTSSLLAHPVGMEVIADHKALSWNSSGPHFEPDHAGQSKWSAVSRADGLRMEIQGTLEFDGMATYRVTLIAEKTLQLDNVKLVAPFQAASTQYQLGLGYRGGFTPSHTDWKWNVAYQQDCVWLGDPEVGAQWRFKGANYTRPLVNIYYGYHPLNLPNSWGNEGRGGVQIHEPQSSCRVMEAYSGARTMLAGDQLEFNFDLMLTPSRPINTDAQWTTRYFHPGYLPPNDPIDKPVLDAKQAGANVLNIHHRKRVNPFINYPFNDFSVPDLKSIVQRAHEENIRLKLYYTTRELTYQMPEIWALKSFGDSIIQPGPGAGARTVINPNGPNPQLTETLEGNFIPAWVTSLDGKYAGMDDLSVITRPDSAWTDYYLHGLDWLVKNTAIDGLYIDDTALDRKSLQRARRILEAGRPAPLIDLHSWNHEDPLAAMGSSTSIYMDLFPYLDRIWLGEGFDYQSASPDYWLVSMSGIPYGVMSEMLQGGGNVWRGMLFGETCRLGWSGDPRSMWKFWDQFGMNGTEMIGWWDQGCPVKTNSKDVLATVYRKSGKTLIAIANWSNESKTIQLQIDWKALGMNPKSTHVSSPQIDGFQSGKEWNSLSGEVPGAKGWLIVAEDKH